MVDYNIEYVLWIDILGFRNFIEKSKTEHRLIEYLLDAISPPKDINPQKIVLLDVGDVVEAKHEITAFSDTIVVSAENSIRGFLYIVNYYLRIVKKLERIGLFARGSLVIGEVYHKENKFFGPAIIEAYELEEKEKYPRVIITKEVLDNIKKEKDETYEFLMRFIKNEDVYFLHSLFYYRLIPDMKNKILGIRICDNFYEKVNLNVISGLKMENAEKRERVIEKYKWLNSYFEKVTMTKNRNLEIILKGGNVKYDQGIYEYLVEVET